MAIRARNVGELLDGALRLYRQDLGLYMFTAIVASVPWVLVTVLSASAGDSTFAGMVAIVGFPVAIVAGIAVWGALMHQMHERLEGREPDLGSSVRRGLRLIFRVAWAGILSYILLIAAVMLMFIIVGVPGIILGLVLPPLVSGILMVALGVAALIFVVFRLLAGLALFLPGIIVEDLGGYASVKRGFALARRGYIRVVGVLLLAWLLMFVPAMAAYFITGTTSMLLDPAAAATGVISMGQLVAQQTIILISSGFTTPFMVACMLLLYFDQRVRLEAFDLQAEADALAG